jgi:chromosome segregation ATPase
LPDAKPPDPVPEPIPLRDLVQAFASTVAATSHNLDQATVDLRNLYLNSGNALLAMMVPPRFTLDEISIDLAFVVVSATPDENTDQLQLPKEDKDVESKPLQSPENLSTKLAGAAKDDASEDAKNKTKIKADGIAASQNTLQNGQTQLQNAQNALQNARNQVPPAQQELNNAAVAHANAVRAKPPNQQTINNAAKRLQDAQTKMAQVAGQINQLSVQVNQLTAVWGPSGTATTQLNRDIQTQAAARQALDGAISTLSDKNDLSDQQIDGVRKAGVDYKQYDVMWANFYKKYESLHSTYDDAVKAFKAKSQLQKMDDFQFSADDNTVVNKIGNMSTGWKTVKDQVTKIVDDYRKTLAALNALVQQVSRVKGSGLKVRVDPAALNAAPVEARQKLHLSFHTQLQQNVKVGDQDIAIGG